MIVVNSLRLKNKDDYTPKRGDSLFVRCSVEEYEGVYRVIDITPTLFTIQHQSTGFKMRLRRSTLSLYSPDVESLVGFLGLYKNREEYEINEENHRLLVVLNEAIANAFVSIPLDNQQLKLICQTMNIL